MNVCFLGSYQEDYQRNAIIRKGLRVNGVRVLECNVPYGLGLRFWSRYKRLISKHALMKEGYEYLIIPEMNHQNMPIAYLLSKIYKKPLIFDPFISRYDTDVMDRKRIKEGSFAALKSFILDKVSLRMADLILADTHQHLYYFKDAFKIPEDRIRVLYLGADDDLFDRNKYDLLPESKERLKVSFYGSFVPLQGVEYIVGAADILREEEIEFSIIGRGETYSEIEDMAKRLNLSNVRFIPPMPIDELPRRIAEADILLGIFGNTPKTQRVIPNKVFQSMAMGKPVITGDTPAVREVFTDKENIFLCRCADENSLSEAILELKESPKLRQRIADNGYSSIKAHFTPATIGRKLIDELKNWKERTET